MDMLRAPSFSSGRRLSHLLRLAVEMAARVPLIFWYATRYRIVYLLRVTFPPPFERVLRFLNPNIVFDFDDNIMILDSDCAEQGVLGSFKKWYRKTSFIRMVAASRLVLANNEYLRDQASPFNENVLVFHESIDTVRHSVRPRDWADCVTIGWIGSPSTAKYLAEIEPALRLVASRNKIRFKVVGAGPNYRPEGLEPFESVPWTLESEAREVQSFDIGVMPQPRSAWAEGKWGTKMLQYHSVGIPGVATYSAANAQLIKDGVNGYFAEGVTDWAEKLERLVRDPGLRYRMGTAGREYVEKMHSVAVRQKQFLALLRAQFPSE